MLFLLKYVEGSPILLAMLQLFQLLEIQILTKCWFVYLDVTAIQPSCQKHLLHTNSQAMHMGLTNCTDLPLFSWHPKAEAEIKLPSIEGCCTKTTVMVKSDHHWQKGLLCPLCWNQIMVLLDRGSETTLLLGLKRKTDLKVIKTLLYNFQCLISN